MDKSLKATMYKGMPSPEVELTEAELAEVNGAGGIGGLGAGDLAGLEDICGTGKLPVVPHLGSGDLTIKLDRLLGDLHNQSYGMLAGSTGCASNPGGPGC